MPRNLSSEAKSRKKILFYINYKPRPQESGRRSGQTCVQEKGIDKSQITNELISIPQWGFCLESAMQIDLIPKR